jgi:hypothetical protein
MDRYFRAINLKSPLDSFSFRCKLSMISLITWLTSASVVNCHIICSISTRNNDWISTTYWFRTASYPTCFLSFAICDVLSTLKCRQCAIVQYAWVLTMHASCSRACQHSLTLRLCGKLDFIREQCYNTLNLLPCTCVTLGFRLTHSLLRHYQQTVHLAALVQFSICIAILLLFFPPRSHNFCNTFMLL